MFSMNTIINVLMFSFNYKQKESVENFTCQTMHAGKFTYTAGISLLKLNLMSWINSQNFIHSTHYFTLKHFESEQFNFIGSDNNKNSKF